MTEQTICDTCGKILNISQSSQYTQWAMSDSTWIGGPTLDICKDCVTKMRKRGKKGK